MRDLIINKKCLYFKQIEYLIEDRFNIFRCFTLIRIFLSLTQNNFLKYDDL